MTDLQKMLIMLRRFQPSVIPGEGGVKYILLKCNSVKLPDAHSIFTFDQNGNLLDVTVG